MIVRKVLVMGAVSAAIGFSMPQAEAAGFFDDFARAFFGRPSAPQQVYSDPLEMTVKPRRKAPKFTETASKPAPPVVKLDPATDPHWYLSDPTLRRGDIVVTAGGVLVYQGRDSDALRRSDFAALGSVKGNAKKTSGAWQQQLQQAAAGGRSFFRYDTPASAIVAATETTAATTR